MKLKQTAVPYTRVVSLPRPDGSVWTFTLRPLPLGFHRRMREMGVVPPVPPTKIARDSTGKPLRDDAGLAVMQVDAHDAQYLGAIELYHQRIATLAFAEALKADTHASFETPSPAVGECWNTYADALYIELENAGFTAGDLISLCDEVAKLSNLLGDHLQRSQSSFSSTGPTTPT
ncbi:MAG: hypothetical protein R3C01_07550 [Planctomycetaceae bacterium]